MPDPSDTSTSGRGSPEDDAFAILGEYRTAREAHEAGLAILASGRHYWVRVSQGRYHLLVPKQHEDELRKEVELTTLFNRYWPPHSLDLPTKSVSKLPACFAVVLLILIFWIQNDYPRVTEIGQNSSGAVVQSHEWWRVVTAMTLHADVGHLAGNLLGLSLFGYLSGRYLGNGLAWILVILAAASANMTSALTQALQSYQSLGASTAVFAALGLLTGFPVGTFLRSRHPIQQRDWLLPFFGGCVLFAWMGGGDFPTDVAAHLWSFAYGTLFAILVGAAAIHAKLRKSYQNLLLLGSLLAVAGCWVAALGQVFE